MRESGSRSPRGGHERKVLQTLTIVLLFQPSVQHKQMIAEERNNTLCMEDFTASLVLLETNAQHKR